MKLEFLIAWDDRTWTTELIEIDGVPDSEILDPFSGFDPVEWAHENLMPLAKYREAVLFSFYGIPDEEEDKDEGV